MTRRPWSATVLPSLLLCACAAAPKPPSADAARAEPRPGSDRDAHGCIGSAGYVWCEGSGRCERPWELARQQGLDGSRAAFDAFCRNPARP